MIGLSYQSLSKKIFVGRLSKDKKSFLSGKEDVTLLAAIVVAEYVSDVYGEGPDEGLVLTDANGEGWEISVRKLTNNE